MFMRIARVMAVLAAGLPMMSCRAANNAPIPAATNDVALAKAPSRETAVFAGGCFWGTQAVFERVKGVVETTAGYSGGSASTAHYDDVTTETTGHAESVAIGEPSVSPAEGSEEQVGTASDRPTWDLETLQAMMIPILRDIYDYRRDEWLATAQAQGTDLETMAAVEIAAAILQL